MSKRVNAKRRRGKQIVDEENQEYSEDERVLRYTSID